MKKFLCFMLLVGMVMFTGCKNPLEEIGDVQAGLDNVDASIHQQISENQEPELSPDNTDSKDDIEIKEEQPTEIDENKSKETETNDAKEEVKTESTEKATTGTITITAYYKDGEGTLIPITRNTPQEEGIAKAAIRSMIDSDENREFLKTFGLYPILPKGTEVLGININDGAAVIDFNNNLLNYETKLEERNIVAGIVYTLSEFKTITKVKILINGYEKEELKFSGNISGFLDRNSILINSDKLNSGSKVMKMDLYLFKLVNDKQDFLVPISKEYIGVDKDELPHAIVRALAKKPSNEKYFTQFPENTELEDWSIKDNILTLDFSKEIKNYGGNAREEGLVKQILHTMKQVSGAEKVRILIAGKEDHLPEGTETSEGLKIPAGINKIN